MSRYIKKVDDKVTINYGYDHVLGYFIEKINKDLISEINEEGIEFEKDSLFSKMSNSEFIKYLKEFKCNPEHIDRVEMDLDF